VTFVLLFVIGTFAVPLALEIYQWGGDNVLTRSGREVMESRLVANAAGPVTGFGRYLNRFVERSVAVGRSLGSFAIGVIALVGILIIGTIAWKALSLFIWLIRSLVGG
jgi:hypothetical protein